jgi:hypothetical protein
VRLLARLGRSTVSACNEASRLLSFYGETIVTMLPASWFAPLLRANARSPSGHSISSRHGDSC